jgi:hypothetical protein
MNVYPKGTKERLTNLLCVIQKHIEEHKEPEIERDKEVEIDGMRSVYHTFPCSRKIIDYWSGIWCYDEGSDFFQEVHRFMEDIPGIKAEKSTEVHSK